ncbi:MAG TPA: FAD-binding and (Fe-S)-binding domain-containing protein [Solirubrobacteraceae bacterium]
MYADRFPATLAGGADPQLVADLETLLGPGRVKGRAIDIVAYASDASCYRLQPQVVVIAHEADDVAKVFAYGRQASIPVTLRGGGTSLNGQGQTSGILVDVRRHFRGVRVLEDGAAVQVKPGTVLGHVNRVLHKHQRRIGPDPASTDIATVGGVIANNSGGMRCGTTQDAYSTLRSLTFVLASGTAIDTAAPDARERFAAEEPELAQGLARIRDEIRADAQLAARIRRKFQIKNTTGYRLCAFLDADDPLDIFARLLVGSEGTLAFIADAVFDTVEHGHHTSTGLAFFDSIEAATDPVPGLVAAGATAVELMVNASLIAAAWTLPGMPEEWKELSPDGAVLLVELRTTDPAKLDALEQAAHAVVDGLGLSRDPHATERLWTVREGMQGIVGIARPAGSSLLIEDVCVAPERIAESVKDIRELLGKHGFLQGVAGHASAGNLHFLLTPNLSEPGDRERYETFMGELVRLIVDKYDGSLKAEHGTGRNMAPYVAHEWGETATAHMWEIKRLADPGNVLNPEVVLSRDPDIHLADLKSTPMIEEDGRAHVCIECGFCEPVCPSRDLTTTPRQRIVVRREMARQPEDSALRAALTEQYEYDAIDTCAADGSCKLVCPLGIDTGALVKALRTQEHGPRAQRTATTAARHWNVAERAGRAGLRAGGMAARVVGDARLARVSPWLEGMPRAAGRLPKTRREGAAAVYVPACINRMFGTSRKDGQLPLPNALVALSERAGKPVWIPDDVAGTCCATPWSSKGYSDGEAAMTERMTAALRRWSEDGALPVVIDASSCAHGLEGVLDPVTWAHDHLLPALTAGRRVGSVAVHPTCSSRHLGNVAELTALAQACADTVVVPPSATCCGMAGDRGLQYPELVAAATHQEAAEVAAAACEAHVSANRTCEIALEQVTGRPYESIIQLLERVTRA